MALTKEQFLSKQLRKVKIQVPEWNEEIWIRELTAKEQDEINATVKGGGEFTNAKLVQIIVCDETGKPLFTEKDLPELEKIGGNILRNIIIESSKHLGVDEEAAQELQKN